MASLIHNRVLLYGVFLIALVDFLYLVATNDTESASFFGLIGILTAFFSKNMIVILSVAIIMTNVLKYGKTSPVKREGMKVSNKKDKEKKKDDDEKEEDDDEKEEDADEKAEEEADEDELVVEPKKDNFDTQNKTVTTANEDRELATSDKMILAQEDLLKRMNKYKPLLDTLNGLTKNIAIVKGFSASDK